MFIWKVIDDDDDGCLCYHEHSSSGWNYKVNNNNHDGVVSRWNILNQEEILGREKNLFSHFVFKGEVDQMKKK